MKKIKDIDFNNKEIAATEYHFYFILKDRPEDWTIEDEIMMLSCIYKEKLLQKKLRPLFIQLWIGDKMFLRLLIKH